MGIMRLIDADALFCASLFCGRHYKLSDAVKSGHKDSHHREYSYSTLMMYEIADAIDDAPTIETGKTNMADKIAIKKFLEKAKDAYNEIVKIEHVGKHFQDVEVSNTQAIILFDDYNGSNKYVYKPNADDIAFFIKYFSEKLNQLYNEYENKDQGDTEWQGNQGKY